jgi:hypothetical protein
MAIRRLPASARSCGPQLGEGGFVAHLRTIFDDANRPMLFINWNTDMGDGWEWSNAEDYRLHQIRPWHTGWVSTSLYLTH